MSCPLKCSWTGDYSELSSHLTASDSHHTRGGQGGAETSRQEAEAIKAQGNARFEARSFQEAIKLYSKAITLDPTQVCGWGGGRWGRGGWGLMLAPVPLTLAAESERE